MTTKKLLETTYDFSTVPPFVVRGDGKPLTDDVINLSANESPFGPSLLVRDAMAEAQASINRYPDRDATELRQAIAKLNNIEFEKIVCSAGSDTLIFNLVLAYASRNFEVILSRYGFIWFRRATLAAGAMPVVVDENNYRFSVDNVLSAITEKTRIIFLANPNNPTGSFISHEEIDYLIKKRPDYVLLVIDDAYQEYAEPEGCPNGIDFAKNTHNVIVTRTLSKIYALAALRIGWAYGPQDIIDNLNRLRQPFNINTIAQKAGVAALKDQKFVQSNIEHNKEWKPKLIEKFRQVGLNPLPSVANFITLEFPQDSTHNAELALDFLHSKKIIPRTASDYGMENFIRISVGTEKENLFLVDSLKEFMT